MACTVPCSKKSNIPGHSPIFAHSPATSSAATRSVSHPGPEASSFFPEPCPNHPANPAPPGPGQPGQLTIYHFLSPVPLNNRRAEAKIQFDILATRAQKYPEMGRAILMVRQP